MSMFNIYFARFFLKTKNKTCTCMHVHGDHVLPFFEKQEKSRCFCSVLIRAITMTGGLVLNPILSTKVSKQTDIKCFIGTGEDCGVTGASLRYWLQPALYSLWCRQNGAYVGGGLDL